PPWAERTRARTHCRCLPLLAPREPLLRMHALAALGTPIRARRDTRSPARVCATPWPLRPRATPRAAALARALCRAPLRALSPAHACRTAAAARPRRALLCHARPCTIPSRDTRTTPRPPAPPLSPRRDGR
ncbi:hypothetical protein PVAP13_3NG141301, partial [Panicum virgatum]